VRIATYVYPGWHPIPEDPIVFTASLNEWSEGHYLEPDEQHGTGWLEAIRAARGD